MVLYSEHKRDAARAENSLTLSFGSELIGMQRDWNEELQACREFPHATHQERYTFYIFIVYTSIASQGILSVNSSYNIGVLILQDPER